MTLRRPAVATLAAAALGALCVLGFAPFDQYLAVWPAPTFALGGLFHLWRKASTAREAMRLGLAWGAGCFLFGVSWIYVSLSQFGGMAPPLAAAATLLFCLYLALFPALVGGLFLRWRSNAHRDALLFAGLWTLSEWLRGTLFTGFPWLAVGYSQSPPSPLAGWASVLGVYGVGFIVALIGGLVGQMSVTGWRKPGIWVSILLLLGFGGLLRGMDWTQPAGSPVTVSLLQGNVPQSLKWDPKRLPLSIDTYLRLAKAHPATLTVLPETALPLYFNEVPRDVLRGLTRHGDALIGVAIGTSDGGYTNGAVTLTPELAATAYAKRHLVPFGEYAPPGFAWFFRFAHIPMSDFTAGPARQQPLDVAGLRIAPNICYEDLFGEELLAALPAATLLVNMSNTAWFGDSLAQPQHLQIAQLRAIETGRVMLRATNTGMTAMVAADGTVAAALPPFVTDALVVQAQGRSGLTPYARWGNLLALLIAIGACLMALRGRKAQSL
ncbi:MAG: apolipoprotein N-acyltransferase [Rhodocyclaceae bacterium]|nr:MAG: apolipoprotein N-acyltransferase [Rhodocyclaceae bacterium]TNC99925.1 MAG: apolipoprotein N-acyltransferase [Rhodocyclaceae bacterium]